MLDTIFIYVPAFNQVVRISEGSGDNLHDDDIKAGYVDYIYYEQHTINDDCPEVDGGVIMLKEPFRKQFNSTKDCIPNVLDMVYGDDKLEYTVLATSIVERYV